jgi:hypothetical protein
MIPLQEALPWSPDISRNFLICDSIETDGRFLLSTMAAQVLTTTGTETKTSSTSTSSGKRKRKLLWISGHAATEHQILTSLKKMGCDTMGLTKTTSSSSSSILTIRSLAVEISNQILPSNNTKSDDGTSPLFAFDGERYLKSVYQDVKKWIQQESNPTAFSSETATTTALSDDGGCSSSLPPILWVVLDDVSSMGTILGDTIVYCFVDSLLTYLSTTNPTAVGSIIRCSVDFDQMAYQRLKNEEQRGGIDQSGWIGAGGLAIQTEINDQLSSSQHPSSCVIPWERYLVDHSTIIDGIIDVLPLPSGFSREAHGRLIFSEPPNSRRGWGGSNSGLISMKHQSLVLGITTTSADAAESTDSVKETLSPTKQNRQPQTSPSSNKNRRNKVITNYCVQDSGVKAWAAPGS